VRFPTNGMSRTVTCSTGNVNSNVAPVSEKTGKHPQKKKHRKNGADSAVFCFPDISGIFFEQGIVQTQQ